MSLNMSIVLIIIGCAIVTIIPRITPFIIIRNMNLPDAVTKWLSFIPICLFTALIMSSILVESDTAVMAINWNVIYAIIPTLIFAIWTKNLSITVIVGIISMAIIRYFL